MVHTFLFYRIGVSVAHGAVVNHSCELACIVIGTIEKYLRDVGAFVVFARECIINKTLVLEYKAQLEKNYALASANSMLAAINSLFKFVGWYDCCVKQFKVQRKTYCSEESELTKQEYIALVRTAEHKKNERLSLLIQTICGTGIRVSELEFITVEAIKYGEAVVSCKGKSRKVFIVKNLCRKLQKYILLLCTPIKHGVEILIRNIIPCRTGGRYVRKVFQYPNMKEGSYGAKNCY